MNSILEKRQKYHIEEQEGISQSFALGEVKDEEHAAEGGNEMEATDEEKQILREAAECLKTIGVSKAFEKLQTLLGKSSFYSQLILEKLKKEDGKAKRKSALLRKSSKVRKVQKAKPAGKENIDCDYAVNDIAEECLADCDLTYFTGGTLRVYQAEGTHYENGINGLLADEMGLGKTVQVIAFICHLYAKGVRGPFLIIAPLSTIPNWISEFRRFAPSIPVIAYHGEKDEYPEIRKKIQAGTTLGGVKVFHTVITNYDRLIRDVRKINYSWRYLVIDEGHRIKNMKCLLIRALKQLNNCGRLLLTGTPLQNNISELWSLLNFLLPEVFFDLDWFLAIFDFKTLCQSSDLSQVALCEKREKQILVKLHEILSPYLLRRIKANVELHIPPKREVIVYAPFTPLQMKYYKAALNGTIARLILDKPLKEEELTDGPRLSRRRSATPETKSTALSPDRMFVNNLRCVRMRWMILSKICMHPYLLHAPLDKDGAIVVNENLVKASGKMMLLDRLLSKLVPRGHKILIYAQILDIMSIIGDYCSLRSFKFCRIDGTMSMTERQSEIDAFNKDKSISLFLLSTRSGGLGINLTAADTVIFFQSDWNPQADLQAEDRCHRIGQDKPVLVFRFVVQGTIDEIVFNRASTKRRLEKLVIHSDRFKGINPNSAKSEDLTDLISDTDCSEIIQFKGGDFSSFLSDSELERILDRSQLTS